MKFKGTWIFTIVVVAAVSVAVWDYQKQQADQADADKAAQLLPDFQLSSVSSFDFVGEAGAVKATNNNGDWQIIEPIQDTADYEALESFVIGLAEQNMADVEVEGEINWSQYGLDQPLSTLTMNKSDGTLVKIEVGSKRSYDDGYYVRLNSENKLYLGSKTWASFLSKTANDLRDRDLYNGANEYNYLEINQAGKKISFVSKDGKWESPQNKNVLIDESALYDYVNLFRHLRADAVVSDVANNAARRLYNINKPELTVVIEERSSGEKISWKAEFSPEKNNEVFVSVGKDRPVYRIQARKMDSMKKTFSHFRDKAYPFAIDHTRIPAFRLKRSVDSKERTFQRRGTKWLLEVEEPHMKENAEAISNMFNEYRNLRVKEFLTGAAAKESVKGKNGLVLLNAVGDIFYEMYWSDEVEVSGNKVFKVWTSLANETFLVDAELFKAFESNEILVVDSAMKSSEKEEK